MQVGNFQSGRGGCALKKHWKGLHQHGPVPKGKNVAVVRQCEGCYLWSYFERLKWATEGSPPNLVALLARVARQAMARLPVRAAPSAPPVTPPQLERIRVKRDAALEIQRRKGLDSASPLQALSSPSTATFSPVTLVSNTSQATPARTTPSQSKTTTPLQVTPPTMQRPIALIAASAQQQHRSVTTPPLNPYTFFTRI